MTSIRPTWAVRLLLAGLLGGCVAGGTHVISPAARYASQPVPVNQVEDAAIWVHPDDGAKSLLIVSNKTRGIEIHNPDGILLKHYDDGTEYAGVDVAYGVGVDKADLAIAPCAEKEGAGIKIWRIDPVKRRLADVTANGMIPVFDGKPGLGIGVYHDRPAGKVYFFMSSDEGAMEQYELAGAGEEFTARRVRQFSRPGKVKGIVVDDERGVVYVAEEKVGIWRYPASPDGGSDGVLVIKAGDNGLVPAITGLAMYYARDGKGYLIAVSQGNKGTRSRFLVYDRGEGNRYLLTIEPSIAGLGAPENSSGIAVTNHPMGKGFEEGMLALKDRITPSAAEDYKIYSWGDIARQGELMIDTAWSPRGK